MSETTPPSFSQYQLAELAAPGSDTFVDGPFGSSLKSHEYVDAGVRLIQLQNIGEGVWRDENKKFITARKLKTLERHRAIPGDIAIAKMADPVARACLVPPVAEQFVVVADCIRLRLDEARFDPGFVVRAINSPYTRREAEKKAIGSTRVRINLSVLKTVACLAPGLPEQQAISRILDTLDTAIHETEVIIAKLKAVKQGLLHDLLTRGIDANGELRSPQAEAPHLYKESPLGRIPKEWDATPLRNLLSDTYRYPSYYGINYVEDGVSEIRGELVRSDGTLSDSTVEYRHISEKTASRFPRVRLCSDDVVMTVRGTIGKFALVPGWLEGSVITANLLKLSPNRTAVEPAWLMHMLLSSAFQERLDAACSATTIKTIQVPALLDIRTATPLRSEQKEIGARLSAIDRRISLELVELEKLKINKSGLMHDLLTGRVRVTPLLAEAEQHERST
ncbi:MAG: restriction endonuclease subunit S [Xanthomonadales bacterium]|nr:restriction endonuclease subunit S [Xanthomonadales bacterium]